MPSIEDFHEFDIRVGEVIHAEVNQKALKPAYLLRIDLGGELGVKTSSAQICDNYKIEELIGRQVITIVNLPPRRVAGHKSEVLVLAAVCKDRGTVLLKPDFNVTLGQRIA